MQVAQSPTKQPAMINDFITICAKVGNQLIRMLRAIKFCKINHLAENRRIIINKFFTQNLDYRPFFNCFIHLFNLEFEMKKNLTNKQNISLQQSVKSYHNQQIHDRNIKMKMCSQFSGIIGEKHTKLINRLSQKMFDQTNLLESSIKNYENQSNRINQVDDKSASLKIEKLEREQNQLRRELDRMGQVVKNYKNAKIEMEIKYDSIMEEFSRNRSQKEILNMKIIGLTDLNFCLIKIIQNSLQILPKYDQDCEQLFESITVVSKHLQNNEPIQIKNQFSDEFKGLVLKLQHFHDQVINLQNYQKRLICSIAQAQNQTKSINQRLSILSNINMNDLAQIKSEIYNINNTIAQSQKSIFSHHTNKLNLFSKTIDLFISPDQQSKIDRLFQELCLVFDQQIHLLQNQKMQFQFTKNKKLISNQKYDCQICQNYEKIIKQIFSIIRQTFKQIKFEFLKQIKQIRDISEISILI